MHGAFDYSSMGLILLIPTSLLWVAVGLEEYFQLRKPLVLLVGWSPKIAYVSLALILPLYTVGYGYSIYEEIHAVLGLVVAYTAIIYLALALYYVCFSASESI